MCGNRQKAASFLIYSILSLFPANFNNFTLEILLKIDYNNNRHLLDFLIFIYFIQNLNGEFSYMAQKVKVYSKAEGKIASIERLYELKTAGAVTDEEFNALKEEILGTSEKEKTDTDITEDLSDFTKSVFNMDTDAEPIPIINETDTYVPPQKNEVTSNLTDGIDFDLDLTDDDSSLYIGIDFSIDRSVDKKRIPDPEALAKDPAFIISETKRVCSAHGDKYDSRDSALMDAEAMEGLCLAPLFLMGAAAAVFFYIVLTEFEMITGGIGAFLINLCVCMGIMPAAVIIPNTVKINKCSRIARELNEELAEDYLRSGYTKVPFEYTNPYVLAELQEIIDGGAEDIKTAVAALDIELSSDDSLAAEKKQADFADNDELAARSAALYVVGKKLIYNIE